MFQYLLPGPHLYFEMVFVQLFFIAIIMKNMILLGSPFVFVVVTNDFSYPKIVPLPFLFSFPSLIKYHHSTNTVLLLLPLFNWSSSLKNCENHLEKSLSKMSIYEHQQCFLFPIWFHWDFVERNLLHHSTKGGSVRYAEHGLPVKSIVKNTECLWKLANSAFVATDCYVVELYLI